MKANGLLAMVAALFTSQFCIAENSEKDPCWKLQLSAVRVDKLRLSEALLQIKAQLQHEHPGVRFDFVLTNSPSKYKGFREITHKPAHEKGESPAEVPNDDPIVLNLNAVPVSEVCKYLASMTDFRLETVGSRAYFFPNKGGTFERSKLSIFDVVTGGDEFFRNARWKNQAGKRCRDARLALAGIGCVFCEGDTATFDPKLQRLVVCATEKNIEPLLRLSCVASVEYNQKWLSRQPKWRIDQLANEVPLYLDMVRPESAKKSR